MRNGYALCTRQGLDLITDHLRAIGPKQADALAGKLRIGIHRDVEVTDVPDTPRPVVSQAFCSALPVAYGLAPQQHWAAFAQLVLDAAYEATMLEAVINARRRAATIVLLTSLGGGAFGNAPEWISRCHQARREEGAGLRPGCTAGELWTAIGAGTRVGEGSGFALQCIYWDLLDRVAEREVKLVYIALIRTVSPKFTTRLRHRRKLYKRPHGRSPPIHVKFSFKYGRGYGQTRSTEGWDQLLSKSAFSRRRIRPARATWISY